MLDVVGIADLLGHVVMAVQKKSTPHFSARDHLQLWGYAITVFMISPKGKRYDVVRLQAANTYLVPTRSQWTRYTGENLLKPICPMNLSN